MRSSPALRGKESFDYFAEKPELAELFNQTMTSVSELTDGPVVAGYDFSAYPTIVDVGGGHGPLLAAILAAAPASRGVLYDLPSGCRGRPKPVARARRRRPGAYRGGVVFRQRSARR